MLFWLSVVNTLRAQPEIGRYKKNPRKRSSNCTLFVTTIEMRLKAFFSERQIKISNKRLRASFVCAYTSSPPRPRSECVSFVLGFFLTPTSTLSWFFLKLLFCCFIYFFHRLILGVFQLRLFCKYEHFYFCLFINTRKKRFQISSFFSLLYRRTQEFGSSWFCCCLLSPSTGETLNNKQGECVLYWSLLFFWRVHGRTNVHADSR